MRSIGFVLAALLVSSAAPSRAEESEGITVVGTGEVLVRPNVLEISLGASGSAELSGDAAAKYRDAAKSITGAFEQLKLKNLKIVPGGLGMQQAGGAAGIAGMMVAGGVDEGPPLKSKIEIGRSLRLVLSGVDKLGEEELMSTISRLLDTAKDAGAVVGESQAATMLARIYGQQSSSSLVTFVVENAEAARSKANQDAFRQARERAKQLADLAQADVGRVLSVEEVPQSMAADEGNAPQAVMMMMGVMSSGGEKRETRVVSDRMSEIPVRVTLKVRFALQERTPGK